MNCVYIVLINQHIMTLNANPNNNDGYTMSILHNNTHSPPHYAYVDNELCHLLLILSRSHSVESKPVDSYSWIKASWFLQLNQSQLITAGYQSPFQILFKWKFSFGKKKIQKEIKWSSCRQNYTMICFWVAVKSWHTH